jgi:polyphosphate kinase 2 (PPK2 family)
MLIGSGIQVLKYYLDISKKEQKRRLRNRRADPLKQWNISPIDEVAIKYWDAYSEARDGMLGPQAPFPRGSSCAAMTSALLD